MSVPIPTEIERITPEWLTRALTAAGAIRRSEVTAFSRQWLSGAGRGFAGQTCRNWCPRNWPRLGR